METIVLLIGFACFGGLLAGYSVARLCPRWMLWSLWGVCMTVSLAAAVVPTFQAMSDGLDGIIILFGAALPFTVCAVIAGLLGMVVRRSVDPVG